MNSNGIIVGIGSVYGPDRIGFDILEALRGEPRLRGLGCGIYRCRAPAADLPALLRGAPWAVLVDAVRAGAKPGTPLHIEAGDLADDAAPASTHGVGVSATLALLELLGELPLRTCIVGIEVGEHLGEPPQDWVARGVVAVVEAVDRLSVVDGHSRLCPSD